MKRNARLMKSNIYESFAMICYEGNEHIASCEPHIASNINNKDHNDSLQSIERILAKCNGDCGNIVASVIECCIKNKDFPSNYKRALTNAFYDYDDEQKK
eukprot:842116_1